MAYYGGGNSFGGFPGGGNGLGGFPGGGNGLGGFPGGGNGLGGFSGGGNVFGGYPGGYNQAPGGVPPNANFGNSGAVYTLGTNMPSVDPNNFSGTVHYGPSSTYVGQYPPGPGGY